MATSKFQMFKIIKLSRKGLKLHLWGKQNLVTKSRRCGGGFWKSRRGMLIARMRNFPTTWQSHGGGKSHSLPKPVHLSQISFILRGCGPRNNLSRGASHFYRLPARYARRFLTVRCKIESAPGYSARRKFHAASHIASARALAVCNIFADTWCIKKER